MKQWVIQTRVSEEEWATIAHFAFEQDARQFAVWANEGVKRGRTFWMGEPGLGNLADTKYRALEESQP